MRLTSWSLASAVFAGDAVKSSGESPMVAVEMNGKGCNYKLE